MYAIDDFCAFFYTYANGFYVSLGKFVADIAPYQAGLAYAAAAGQHYFCA